MIKTKQPITSINGFSIGDTIRLKDGDGREHTIKSFSIEGLNEFFFEVQFEDGSWAMLDNIELLPSNLDDVRLDTSDMVDCGYRGLAEYFYNRGKQAGAEWMVRQGETVFGIITKVGDKLDVVTTEYLIPEESEFERNDRVIIQIRKK